MASYAQPSRWRSFFLLALTGTALPMSPLRAQAPTPASPDQGWRQPLLGREMIATIWKGEPAAEAPPPGRSARFRMFGMVPGFINDPLGLDSDDDPAVKDDPVARLIPDQGDASGLQVSMGNDNPYFDLRLPGDPGGVGFFRLHSQVQLVETGKTSVSLNLQAVTPAGQQYGGVNEGPTVLTPGMSLFQELGLGAALQGFVGQNIRAVMHPNNPYGRNLQYGMGVQYPLLQFGGPDRGLYLFMQALGRYYYDNDRVYNRAPDWSLVPGVHMRVNDKCWFSLGASRYSLFTCSWQF
jgi:hypothetical protein